MSHAGPWKVLVVEDGSALRLVCRLNLELDGFDVLEAASLREARERLDATAVDVVLLDLHLGAESGQALVDECRTRSPRIPVALVSGSADLTPAQLAGADAVLPKPFEIEELTATVRALAAGAGGAG